MNRQYYYLVAGLPDLFFDDKKLALSTSVYRKYLSEFLSEKEMVPILLPFWKFDNQNLIQLLGKSDAEFDPRGILTAEQLEDIVRTPDDSFDFHVPDYLLRFVGAYKSEEALIPGKSWELQLSELYYEYASKSQVPFVKDWFSFERDLNNLLTAHSCRENNLSIDKQIIGNSELVDKLIKSSAKDFGINDEIEEANNIFKALDENDLMEREKKIDTIKWSLIEEHSFFHYFSIEKLFAFLIKLFIAERWIGLDRDTGKKLFEELLAGLEANYEFPAEFKLN